MRYLIAVTLLWAFSFSLIGVYLAGKVDPWFAVLMRIALATLMFVPFLKLKGIQWPLALKFMAVGAVQLGLMYGFYYQSFLYLSVPEVLLFTVMTPIYITLINDALNQKFNRTFLLTASIATLGAIAIRYDGINANFITGLVMVQCANLCFATGQVTYKRLMEHQQIAQQTVFAWFFIGALIVALCTYAAFGDSSKLPTTNMQWGILIYLGIIASGVGYFVWNKGATLVDVGTLAIMNNLLIPAGIVVNVLIWNREADLGRLAIGGGVIVLALWLNKRWRQ
ncbi:DMT family transporter [Alteromonadaceae bacterium BrNp21-10]|nr:DMT family transporter [Alteromonadaceae bacterium BrNp21-10]